MTTILEDLTPIQQEPIQQEPELIKAEPAPKKTAQKQATPKTLEDWQKQKTEYTKELHDFLATEKVQMSGAEAREFRKKAREIRSKIGDCRVEIAKLKQQKHSEAKKVELSGVALKQSRFLILLKQGYSISNIVRHSDGVDKKSIENIMTDTFIADCERVRRGFADMWKRWKTKYLK